MEFLELWKTNNKKEQFLKESELIYFLNICGIFWAWHISVFLKDKIPSNQIPMIMRIITDIRPAIKDISISAGVNFI